MYIKNIPPLASDDDKGYVVKSNPKVKGYNLPYILFDKNNSNYIDVRYGESDSFSRIELTLPKPRIVTRYSITCNYGWKGYEVKSWKILGSNDKIDWVELDNRTNINWDNIKNTYDIENSTIYKHYAFLPTAKISPYNGACYVSEIDFFYLEYERKYLIQDKDSNLWSYNDNGLIQISDKYLSEDTFKNSGFNDYKIISQELLLSKFDSLYGLKLLVWTDDIEETDAIMTYEFKNPYRPIDILKKNNNGICNILFKEL